MKFTRPFRILTIAALLCVAAAAVDTSFPSIAHAQQLGTNVITNANLTRAAAYTVKGNATSAAASVADTAFPLVNAIGSAGTTFTIASGCATVSNLVGGPTAGKFQTSGTSCTPVITLPAAPTGWVCIAQDLTTSATFRQTASTTTSCTVTATVTANDTITFVAFAY